MSRQTGQAAVQGVLHGTSQEFYQELLKPTMQQWQLPLDGRGPLLQQTRSCAPAREQPSKAPRDRRTTAHNVFGPPPAFPLPICTTPGATARSARRGRDASRAHAHPRRVEPTGFKTGQNKALRHHAKVFKLPPPALRNSSSIQH